MALWLFITVSFNIRIWLDIKYIHSCQGRDPLNRPKETLFNSVLKCFSFSLVGWGTPKVTRLPKLEPLGETRHNGNAKGSVFKYTYYIHFSYPHYFNKLLFLETFRIHNHPFSLYFTFFILFNFFLFFSAFCLHIICLP